MRVSPEFGKEVMSYTHLFVEDKVVFSYHDGVYPEMLYLFSPDEFLRLKGNEAALYAPDLDIDDMSPEEIEELETFVYAASAGVLKDRLDVLGFGKALVKEVFEESLGKHIESAASFRQRNDDFMQRNADLIQRNASFNRRNADKEVVINYVEEQLKELQKLDYDTWVQQLDAYISSRRSLEEEDTAWSSQNRGPLENIQDDDQRIILRAILEHVDEKEVVALELFDLVDGGLLDEQRISDLRKSGEFFSGVPIILTEGTYDTQVLKSAIEILKPHIASYIRFLDYDFKNEGGASFAASTLKSFAAAGISNNIVAIFDNDSAAYEAVSALKGIKLPPQYKVIHYPDIALANNYPTLGPQGNVMMNVNGLAGSIELYLGTDVLKDDEGNLMPVQWKGYMSKIKSYQGEVLNKALVQKAFDAKLKNAKAHRKNVDTQDWSGLNAILDRLIETLSKL